MKTNHYHYTGCGLPNVWLVNGFTERDTSYGKTFAIQDVEGLHFAIADELVARKPHFSGAELKFIRLQLELTQKSLGELIGKKDQTVSLWERDEQKVDEAADRLVRALYREFRNNGSQLRALIEKLNAADAASFKLTFKIERGWKPELIAA